MHISVGDLLRAEVAAGTPAGKRAQGFMDAGALVPNEVRHVRPVPNTPIPYTIVPNEVRRVRPVPPA